MPDGGANARLRGITIMGNGSIGGVLDLLDYHLDSGSLDDREKIKEDIIREAWKPINKVNIFYLIKAAQLEHAPSQNKLACLYKKSKEYGSAVEWFTKAAEQGYAEAQYNLALLYAEGEGVEENLKIAVEWFTKAAKQGYALAQNNLACLYQESKEYGSAVEWFTKAAVQGNPQAQCNLALLYAEGKGVEKDLNIAIEWLTKADEQKFVPAKELLLEKQRQLEEESQLEVEEASINHTKWRQIVKRQSNDLALPGPS